MNTHLKPVYTAQLVSGAKQSLAGLSAMGTELQTKMLPGLASQLHLSQLQLTGYLAANFPALTASLASIPATLDRVGRMVNAFDHGLSDYHTAQGTSLLPLVWLLMAAGLLVAGIGGIALLQSQGQAAATAPKERIPLRERLAAAPRLGH